MSRTNVNHVDFDEQDPSREADGDKKPKSKRPASENLHLHNLPLRMRLTEFLLSSRHCVQTATFEGLAVSIFDVHCRTNLPCLT